MPCSRDCGAPIGHLLCDVLREAHLASGALSVRQRL